MAKCNNRIKNLGVDDILIACIGGLKGFPEAISSVFPKREIQLCIVHVIRNSLKYVLYKDYKVVVADLKTISQIWKKNWEMIKTFFCLSGRYSQSPLRYKCNCEYKENELRSLLRRSALTSLIKKTRKTVYAKLLKEACETSKCAHKKA